MSTLLFFKTQTAHASEDRIAKLVHACHVSTMVFYLNADLYSVKSREWDFISFV